MNTASSYIYYVDTWGGLCIKYTYNCTQNCVKIVLEKIIIRENEDDNS